MHSLQLPPLSAAENLAADELILDHCEAGLAGETLLFWEPCETFVVVGYANQVAKEVNVAACAVRDVPIFRRCSGGGTVVQMPGGLNYSLILPISETGPTRNISAANQFIMERNRQAISNLLPHAQISVRGHTDLCLGNLKFAGNSQRRRKNFLLFHGTLLLNCDLALITELLQMPSMQPDYREDRAHAEFVTNLKLPFEAVRDALIKEWRAQVSPDHAPLEDVKKLAREKYSTREWNFKF